ncbi:PLP-dependent transferase, partial [Aspergillus steynii IBT 23096]
MAPSTMSQRAQEATASSKSIMWDVVADLYCKTSNPDGFVNVGLAENMLMHSKLLEAINTKLELPTKWLTYNDGPCGSTRTKTAVSNFLNRHFNPATPILPDQVLVTNGVSSAIEHLSWALADSGEGILLGRPYYGTFIADISARPGTNVVPVGFNGCDPLSSDAVEKYEEALLEFQQRTGRQVKALMLCHPHNPLGRCYPREVLIDLMRLCQKYRMHFISDEIYALSTWENTVDHEGPAAVSFVSALSIDLEGIIDPELVHVLWGMSKDFGANGLRLGAIISQGNEGLMAALRNMALYSYPSAAAEYVSALVLEDVVFTDEYIQLNRRKLGESYAFVVQRLREQGIQHAQGCNAAFFLWVDLGKRFWEMHPEVGADEQVSDRVMQRLVEKKVFLASGPLFGSEEDGWFRIVFSHPKEYLEEALRRIVEAL